ncbi:MAG: TatD family hydrolase [Acidimicrobiia bacterium]
MFIDAHAHLDKYNDDDVERVLAQIEQDQILTLSVSVDERSFLRSEAIAARSPLVVPSFGIHPAEAPRFVHSLDEVEDTVLRSPLIGEIGLDHRFVTDTSQFDAQRTVFRRFLTWAAEQNKIVNLHCAGAEQDTARMLSDHHTERAIVHWYSGPLDDLTQLIQKGCMFSVGVEIRQSDHIRQIARMIPSTQLLTETDNPGGLRWLTEESGYPTVIASVVDELARVREVSSASLLEEVRSNMANLIRDDPHMRPWLASLA